MFKDKPIHCSVLNVMDSKILMEVNRLCMFIKVFLQLYKDYLQQTPGSMGMKYSAIFETNIMNIQEMEDDFVEDTVLPDEGMRSVELSIDEQLLLNESIDEVEINMDDVSTRSSSNEVEINMDDITTESSSSNEVEINMDDVSTSSSQSGVVVNPLRLQLISHDTI